MVRVWHPDAEVTHMVVPLLTSSSGEVPAGARRKKRTYRQTLTVISLSPPLLHTAENLRAELGSRLCLFAEIQLRFIDCRESLLSFMDAVHSQIFRWDDEEMSGYPFLCQSQKPLPNRALADTGRLLARQTLVCVSRSSKYLHLIPKGSID